MIDIFSVLKYAKSFDYAFIFSFENKCLNFTENESRDSWA